MTRTLTMMLAIALVSQAAGCVIQTTDRDHGDGGHDGDVDVATISARWALRNMSDGATTRCPAGFDTMMLLAQAIDANGDPVGEPNSDLFDCDARAGVATDLAPDVYQVWLEVRTGDLGELYAQSLSQVLDVRQADARFETDILNDGGVFQLSWDLVDRTTLRPLSCGQAGAGSIDAVSTSITDAHRIYEDARACDDHTTVTDGLLEGTYTVTIEAISATTGDATLGTAMTLTNRRIADRNQVTDLGHILIPITAPAP